MPSNMLPHALTLAFLLPTLMQVVQGELTNTTSLCSPSATPPKITKGERTYVCVNVNDKYRTLFMPVTDQFTVLRVTDSWNDTRIGGDALGSFVTVSTMAMRSTYKLYASERGHIYPYMTAIVSVKKGEVTGVTWDDGCYFCDHSMCEPNSYRYPTNVSSQLTGEGYTCFNQMSSCSGTNATACDLTIYVGWTGTDSNGDYLSSAGMRMSQFAKYSITSYFKKLASSFNSFMPASRFDS
ncbi:hypothetical protein Poli38472_001654 [Pythium oligandrum]|uniref:Uncharacterized protein n=1 Tax=Pythium oligandrum TaxID=41045 RepID=A0A8K1CV35_PYTOL|nr:hypothetical protein Poli38472_001654 [Pythium oligandrum]|eukprot:TMW69498.1 hypothetical protein Poli38472_001654 [Pythium oligandrum]